MTDTAPKFLLIGEILRPHGVRGELKMRILTDYPERIKSLDAIFLGKRADDPDPQPFHVKSMRMNQEYGLLTLQEVADRNAAERLREMFVMVDIEHAVPLDEGEFYLYQVIGLHVVTDTGDLLGTITDLLNTGANDVYVVEGERYGEVLLPAIDSVILKVDIAAQQMTVHIPDGLLPAAK
jgi:16S rRNA processing protein RimM